MSDLKRKFRAAKNTGELLGAIYQSSLGERGNRKDIADVLVKLHNTGEINVIEAFSKLKNDSNEAHDFFISRNVLEKALPNINSPVDKVMECVRHLTREAGSDMTSGILFCPFIEYCLKDEKRPEQVLELIEFAPEEWSDFLNAAVVSGTTFCLESYVDQAIKLTTHKVLKVRRNAVFSVGHIDYQNNNKLIEKGLESLERIIDVDDDDELLRCVIRAAFEIYRKDQMYLDRVFKVIEKSAGRGGDISHYALSEIFGLDFKEVPSVLLELIKSKMADLNPLKKGTIDNIDMGLSQIIRVGDHEEVMSFWENIFIECQQNLDATVFGNASHYLRENHKLLSKMITRWFLNGDRYLCRSIRDVLSSYHDNDPELEIDANELENTTSRQHVFLARKVIGFLFTKPITCTSFVLSLLEYCDAKVQEEIKEILFETIVMNYRGKIPQYLKSCNQHAKHTADLVTLLDDYLDGLKSAGTIAELHPSQRQREIYHRHMMRLFSDSYKEAEKGSFFLSFMKKTVLLYGRKTINYVYRGDGEPNRIETPLHSFSTEVEYPSQEVIDPFGLDYMLRVFRAESYKA